MMKIDKKKLLEMRYPSGTVLELTSPIDDPYTPKQVGDKFVVSGIDDSLQIHGHWLNGGSMALVFGVDEFRIVNEEG